MTTADLSTRESRSPRVPTRTLLGFGVIAGPGYVVVSLLQALTRDGFDLTRHAWSLLTNGDLGWLQVTNFILSGAMTIAFAVGLRRVLPTQRWAPRLIGAYGASLVAAGVFRADPAQGFPAGTPADAAEVSWHGLVHFVVAAIGFVCIAAAGLVLARYFAGQGARGWGIASRIVAVAFLIAFAGIAAGGGSVASVLGFVVAVVGISAWLSAVAVRLYRAAE